MDNQDYVPSVKCISYAIICKGNIAKILPKLLSFFILIKLSTFLHQINYNHIH